MPVLCRGVNPSCTIVNNYPVLFKLGNIYVLNLGFLNAIGAVASVTFGMYLFMSMFPDIVAKDIVWIVFLIPISIVFFSKAFHYILLGKRFFENPRKHLAETAFYNAVVTPNFIIHNSKYTDPVLHKACSNLEFIHVIDGFHDVL